jgi:hypothetical protein
MRITFKREDLKLFTSVVDRTIKNKKDIYITSYNGEMSFFCSDDFSTIVWKFPCDFNFQGGVPALRLIEILKKLNTESIDLTFKREKVYLKSEKFLTDFPNILGYRSPKEFSVLYKYAEEPSKKIHEGFGYINTCMKETSKFKGILIDSNRICNFDDSLLKVCYHGASNSPTIVVPSFLGGVIKSVSGDDLEGFAVLDKGFGVFLRGGLVICSSTMDNVYPEGYLNMVEAKDVSQPYLDKGFFKFDKKEFLRGIELVSAAVGVDDALIGFEVVNKNWRIVNKSFNKIESSILLESSSDFEMNDSFRLHKKNLVSVLKQYREEVFIYNFSRKFLVISNEDQSDLTFLFKCSF